MTIARKRNSYVAHETNYGALHSVIWIWPNAFLRLMGLWRMSCSSPHWGWISSSTSRAGWIFFKRLNHFLKLFIGPKRIWIWNINHNPFWSTSSSHIYIIILNFIHVVILSNCKLCPVAAWCSIIRLDVSMLSTSALEGGLKTFLDVSQWWLKGRLLLVLQLCWGCVCPHWLRGNR